MASIGNSRPNTIRLPHWRLAARRGVGPLVFLMLLLLFLLQWPQLKPHLFDGWDPFWLKAYAVAVLIAGTLVWCCRGRVLLVIAGIVAATILLVPVLCGATGWALPKLALITALAIGLGQRGIKLSAPSATLSCLDRLLLTTLFGFGILSLAMMVLGLLHLWRASIVAALFAVTGSLVVRDFADVCRDIVNRGLRPVLARWSDADFRLPALMLSSLCICSFGSYLCAVAPNTHWDVLHYHLGIPTIYVQRGGIVPLDHTCAVHFVRNAEMLYSLGLLVEGQPLPTLFNFLFGVLSVGMVASLGTLLAGRRVGYVAGAIFFAVPLVSYVISEGMIDVIPTAYILAAAYAFFQWQRGKDSQWLRLFSLFSGVAVGTKLNAAVFLSPLALVLLADSLRPGLGWRPGLQRLRALLAPGMAVSLPWFILAWVRTGNPVFPFLNNVFHSPEWYQDSFMSGVDWQSFGVGKSWWHALRLPWDLAFHGDRFGEFGWFATGGVFLLGLPFGYFALPRRQRTAALMLLLVTAFSLVVFFKLVQYARYMLPLTALCAVVAGMNCVAAWKLLSKCPRFNWLPLGACFLLALGWMTFSRVVHLSTLGHFLPGRYPWQFALGSQSADECLRNSNLTEYEFLNFVKERLPDKPVVFLGIGLGANTYCGDAVEYSRWHSLKGKRMVEEQSARQLLSMLEESQVRYLAVNEQFVQQNISWQDIVSQSAALNVRFQQRHCEPVFGRNGVVLYRLRFASLDDSAWQRGTSLVDMSLRPGADGSWGGWNRSTEKVRALPLGSHPHDPDAGVLEVTYPDCIGQQCQVRENTLYSLSADFWSPSPDQVCMLHILWADESGHQTHNEVSLHEVTASPTRFEMSRTSAAGTRFAHIYVRAKDGSKVLMSRPRLVERPEPSAQPDPQYDLVVGASRD